ncbi:uncharacterized protein LOC119682287 [Teleopsis dalmanni]|uniref:uncharacterized protein LOC119682287 n=1 Tax=Teleopsis dalmanni TaxID=139649 RepID=UPI000D32C95F|nr:uncharacterized protein LOC119682287 [Teleopsis dalmanni]
MFLLRASFYRQILSLLLLIFVVVQGQKYAQKRCAELTEYCQVDWDCCSNRCMSYLYRCTRNYTKQNNYIHFEVPSQNPTSYATLDEILASNFDNDNDNVFEQIDVRVGNAKAQEKNSRGLQYDNRFNQRKEYAPISTTSPFIYRIVKSNEGTTATSNTYPGAMTSNPIGPQYSPTCKEIGSKCYRNDECCTQRCHDYLHKCVT